MLLVTRAERCGVVGLPVSVDLDRLADWMFPRRSKPQPQCVDRSYFCEMMQPSKSI